MEEQAEVFGMDPWLPGDEVDDDGEWGTLGVRGRIRWECKKRGIMTIGTPVVNGIHVSSRPSF